MLEKRTKAIGLMSGTSADGVDVAYIDTDGKEFVFFGPSQSFGFPRELKDRLINTKVDDETKLTIEKDLTLFHFESIKHFSHNLNL